MVGAAIVYGFTGSGSPAHARAVKFDAQRVSDLTGIKSQINQYYYEKMALPQSLTEISDKYSYVKVNDPDTKKMYTYIPGTNGAYQLCATFSLSNEDDSVKKRSAYDMYGDVMKHPKGYKCFDNTVDQTYRNGGYNPNNYYPTPTFTPTPTAAVDYTAGTPTPTPTQVYYPL